MWRLARRWRGSKRLPVSNQPDSPMAHPRGKKRRHAFSTAQTRVLGATVLGAVVLLGLLRTSTRGNDYTWWTNQGCPVKILRGNARMNETMEVRHMS